MRIRREANTVFSYRAHQPVGGDLRSPVFIMRREQAPALRKRVIISGNKVYFLSDETIINKKSPLPNFC